LSVVREPAACFIIHGDRSAAGHNPGDNLTQYNIAWDYIFQATHTTTGGYVDTMNFNIKSSTDPSKGKAVTVRAFSISNIHGALGDNGQCYKEIVSVSPLIDLIAKEPFAHPKIIHGCGTTMA